MPPEAGKRNFMMNPVDSPVLEKDLQLAFDVGHSSIGWAVLQSKANTLNLLGCGSVIFAADDCLASQRRQFRRQRRHIRSTRQRIDQIKRLLATLGVLSSAELDAVSTSSPWFYAARVLRGGALLSWPQLWDVLRWYAHNRGYDGNKAWSRQEEDAAAQKDDTEKVEAARSLYQKYSTHTMAETWCAVCGLDPLGEKTSCALPGNKRPKGLNAAFPREDVEREVQTILEKHVGTLPKVDAALIQALMEDWQTLPCPEIHLPARFHGGLLFGQLVPRFENRIIARCPITYEQIYQQVLAEEGDMEKAKHEADRKSKVPNADCVEFFRYRWTMQLANVQVATDDPKRPRRLTAEERLTLDAKMKERGALTKGEFTKAVDQLTGGAATNVKQMMMHPDADKALVTDPVQRLVTGDELSAFYAVLPEPLQKRLKGKLRLGKRVTLADIRGWLEGTTSSVAFDGVLARKLEAAATKRSKKMATPTRESLLEARFQVDPASGRAPHSRAIMQAVADFVFTSNRHPAEGRDGAKDNGPLFRSEAIRTAQLQRAIDDQTNNHLVRHRLRILERLHTDILKEYAGEEEARIGRVTIEVNRDLRELSGKTAKQIAQDQGLRLSNFKSVSAKLEKQLEGKNVPITPGLIRKARIAEDLGWTCPYTGKPYDVFDLISRRVDKDHIIPRSERASDSLDSLVITFAEVNRMKGKRTAAKFVEDCQSQVLEGAPHLSIKPLSLFLKDVDSLEAFKGHDDDKRRKRNRKRLLLIRDYVEKEFKPADLTQTSQLVRLGAESLQRHYVELKEKPVIVSLPGSVTGAVRKSWDVLGCLAAANKLVIDPETGQVRTKTEIRDITHLHHALDASVIAYTSRLLPRDGGAWELLVKRRLNAEEQVQARKHFGSSVEFEKDGTLRLADLPISYKENIRKCLAERRVVQHIPAEMEGLRAEMNAWRVIGIEGAEAKLRQRIRQTDGTRPVKDKKEKVSKLIGLRPGKLQDLKAALVVADNYGLALDPEPQIIPFHKVWTRLRELRNNNSGKGVRVLRNGMLVNVPQGKYQGTWKVFSVKNNSSGMALDLGKSDVTRLQNKTEGHKINVLLASLMRDGLQICRTPLTGLNSL